MLSDVQIRVLEKAGQLPEDFKGKKEKLDGTFEREYQHWYSVSVAVLKQLLPDRLNEFISLYQPDPKRKDITVSTYSIQDWLNGIKVSSYLGGEEFDHLGVIMNRLGMQFQILKSAETRFQSVLYDIRQMVQADLFDLEIDASRELHRNGFFRAAGAVVGVVLEKHLSQVCSNHSIRIRKKNPTIGDLNDLLKANNVIDVPTWRFIQHLADLRNICDHDRKREPTKEEASDLIEGTDKITKTVF